LSLVRITASARAAGDFAHQRPLARIAVAAAAEDADQAPAASGGGVAQRRERLVQRIRRVGVVDHRQRLPVPAEGLHAAGRRSQSLQHGGRLVERHARGQQRAQHGEQVGDVERRPPPGLDVGASLRVTAVKRWPRGVAAMPSAISAPSTPAAAAASSAYPITCTPLPARSRAILRPSASSRLSTADFRPGVA
jgi:hypothetical protein